MGAVQLIVHPAQKPKIIYYKIQKELITVG